ncbi:MAG: putative molybdenum carrier protein [Acidobacteriota bacterium]
MIAGGQTGVDQAALWSARAAGLEIGGWCPPGRRSEAGEIPPDLPLIETPVERSQEAPEVPRSQRTAWNVRDSDATLVLRAPQVLGPQSPSTPRDPGTEWTLESARRLGRPVLEVTPPSGASTVRAWLSEHSVAVLHVAGPSEATAPGVGAAAIELLAEVFAP